MSAYLDEAQVEVVTIDCLCELGYECTLGPDIAPCELAAERDG